MSGERRKMGRGGELVVLLLSLVVVGGFVATAVWLSAASSRTDFGGLEVSFDAEETVEREEGFFVPYAITNRTSSGLAAAEIWIEVFDGGTMVETAEVRVEFLAVESRQEGLYVSKYDPKLYDFRGRLESLLFP